MGDYSAERYDPKLSMCGNKAVVTLHFNGTTLTMLSSGKMFSYPAVSGRPGAAGGFDYSVDNQKQKNKGPIPEGTYWIRPDELQENSWSRVFNPTSAWGNFWISIHPFTTTETYGRGGFFIHGGDVPGSAGCVDLTSHMDQFVKDLKAELAGVATCQIHLTVEYPKIGDYPKPKYTYA